MIDAIDKRVINEKIINSIRVTPEEFLIAIGYLEDTEQSVFVAEKLKVADVHYIDSYYPSDTYFLSLYENSYGEVYLQSRSGNKYTSIGLSPESLIALGKDLIQIGVSKQIEEESNED